MLFKYFLLCIASTAFCEIRSKPSSKIKKDQANTIKKESLFAPLSVPVAKGLIVVYSLYTAVGLTQAFIDTKDSFLDKQGEYRPFFSVLKKLLISVGPDIASALSYRYCAQRLSNYCTQKEQTNHSTSFPQGAAVSTAHNDTVGASAVESGLISLGASVAFGRALQQGYCWYAQAHKSGSSCKRSLSKTAALASALATAGGAIGYTLYKTGQQIRSLL